MKSSIVEYFKKSLEVKDAGGKDEPAYRHNWWWEHRCGQGGTEREKEKEKAQLPAAVA